ncbi:MAG: alpha/beta hydrolase [Deltaproteobacteria bacterium]|nr:alpha/beta hydrolase [Deltaproteobacteria bacterium]
MTDLQIPETRSVDIAGGPISYLYYPASGPTPGPAAILLHATGFMPWLWHPVARRLLSRFRIIIPYFCDHRVAKPEDGLSWLTLAEDLAAFLTALGPENPFIVGHSMGGAVAAICAAKFGLSFKKMLLFEPIFLPRNFYGMKIRVDQHPLASRSINRKNSWESRDNALSYLKSKPLFASWDNEALELYVTFGMVEAGDGSLELACTPQHEAALFMGSIAYDPWPVLSKVDCPVLVVEAEHSENKGKIPFRQASELFPNGEFKIMSGAGHLIPMEKPVETADLIMEFF